MQCQWINKNVDLNLLSKRVQKFLENKNFRTEINEMKNGFVVIGVLRETDGSTNSVRIEIHGSQNKFLVKFKAGEDKRVLSTLSPIASFIGLGFYVQRKMKQMNFYDKIEEDFWTFMDETVASLESSARSTC
jgi:hypothetical protein